MSKEWFERQWNDIKGNAKWAFICTVLAGAGTVAALLVHGLPFWNRVALVFLFFLLVIWAATATWMARRNSAISRAEFDTKLQGLRSDLEEAKEQIPSISMNGIPLVGPAAFKAEKERQEAMQKPLSSLFSPLQIEALTLSKEILRFIEEMGPTPTLSKEAFGGFNKEFGTFESAVRNQEYLEANSNLERPWMLKFGSTWEADFKNRVVAIVPKLGKVGIDANGIKKMNDEISPLFVKNNAAFEIAKSLAYAAQGIDTMKVVPFLSEVPK